MSAERELKNKVRHYGALTEKALEKVELNAPLNELQEKIALDFLQMARNYFNDARHFEGKSDFLTALAAFSYAHAWLDAGVRAGLFKSKDSKLFTMP